jgi:hypothetical protein
MGTVGYSWFVLATNAGVGQNFSDPMMVVYRLCSFVLPGVHVPAIR